MPAAYARQLPQTLKDRHSKFRVAASGTMLADTEDCWLAIKPLAGGAGKQSVGYAHFRCKVVGGIPIIDDSFGTYLPSSPNHRHVSPTSCVPRRPALLLHRPGPVISSQSGTGHQHGAPAIALIQPVQC